MFVSSFVYSDWKILLMSQTESIENTAEKKTSSASGVSGNPKKLSREIGLEIGSLCGRHFLKLKHLHYGYWPKDLEVDITNLYIAQEKYTDFLLANIPEGVKSILDVGCGSGQNAKKLADAGYAIDCVSPSPMLAANTRDLLGPGHEVYESYYESLSIDKRYDLVLFSESFQYIKIEDAIEKTRGLLKKDGFLMISDIFKKDVEGRCPLSGGHSLSVFNSVVSQQQLELIKDLDITEQTAPNIDIENKLFIEVGLPAWNLLDKLMLSRYPLTTKFLKWKYRKKIKKLEAKYFDGTRTGDNFKKFKCYKLLIYKIGDRV